MPLKPPRLALGDTIGLVAPASAPANPQIIDQAEALIARLGFKTLLAPNVRKRWGFLAGSDQERASDLMGMFFNRQVKAIVCLRGGYGSARLLPLIDFPAIRSHPKIFVGYSDITSLHCAFLARSNLVSFHGPMLSSDFSKVVPRELTCQNFLRTLMQASPPGSLCQCYTGGTISVLRPGVAHGRLIGGNLSILCASLGTPYQPSFKNKIVFFEDVDEVPYRFDRMLTQLLNAGLLQQVVGIAIGVNKNCLDPKSRKSKEYRQTLADVLAERLAPLKVPIVSGLPFGHVRCNATLPVGALATLDADRGDLVISESAVV